MSIKANIKFSGVVVTCNDSLHLVECLSHLSFCEEIVVVDLGSKDSSVNIAKSLGGRVVHHKWVPAVEYVREFAVNQTRNQWVVFVDPDLIFPTHLVPSIEAKIEQDPSLGVIAIPYRNYFCGKPIKHGRWGGNVAYPAVFRKDAVEFRPVAHRGFRFRPGFNSVTVGGTEADVIRHYWVDSIEHLYRKVRRYIPLEGPARYADGERFSYWRLLSEVPYAVFSSLLLRRGILDGITGMYLSLFYGWLTWNYLLSLRDYQREVTRQGLSCYGKPGKVLRGLFKVGRKMLAASKKFLLWLPMPTTLPWGGWWLAWSDAIGKHMRLHDDFEQREQDFLLRYVKPGMTVLDIGAHQGLYTLLASKKVGPQGQVIAFEPSPRELRRLYWNLMINRCRNVRVVPSALGSSEGTTELFVCLGQETGCNSLRLPQVSEPIRKVVVQITTLDRYLERIGIEEVDFVKIDVEGAELEALKGASRLLSDFRPLILCELADVRTDPWGYRSLEIYEFLAVRGYRWFSIMSQGRLQPCPRKEKFHENLIAVPVEKVSLVSAFLEAGSQCIEST